VKPSPRRHPRWISACAALVAVLATLAEASFRISIWYVAVFVAMATYIVVTELIDWWRARARKPFEYESPTTEQLEQRFNELQEYASSLGPIRPGMVESAIFLLDQAKETYDHVLGSADSHETKARSVLGIVAGATGALGVFGLSKEGRAVVPGPIVIDALGFAVIAFVCLLYVLRVKRYKRPELSTYYSGATVGPSLRVALPLALAPGYAKMASELEHRIRHEPRAIYIAYISVTAAAVLVLLNATTPTAWGAGRTSAAQGAAGATPGLAKPAPSRTKPEHASQRQCNQTMVRSGTKLKVESCTGSSKDRWR
jgi:hypothetical protein